jgi:signal transduction histidine kinase
MKPQLAPQTIISLSAMLLLYLMAMASYLAVVPPWLGMTLGASADGAALVVLSVDPEGPAAGRVIAGDRLVALGSPEATLVPADIMEEPDALPTYRDYNAFFDRQQTIYRALVQPPLMLYLGDGRVETLTPHPHRSLGALPWLFWYQLACGAIVFLAGMSVLAFRPREKVTLYYALTGFGLLLASASAAIYSTRELAMAGDLFYMLSLLNQFGTLLFAGPFISILWYYPQRVNRFPFGPVVIGCYMLSWLLNWSQLFDSLDVAMRYPIFIGLVINLALAVIQWRLSHAQPVQRAILKWFLLAWLSGTTFYVGLHTIPLMLGMEVVISQSLAWGILLTVYLGIALGITRYRLFNLDRWVLTGWFWFLGGVAVIAMDGLLVSQLDLNNHLALATTLGIAGWLYFPLRQFIWSRLSWYYRRGTDYRELLPSLLTTALNTRPNELPREWSELLGRTFSPLNIEVFEMAVPQVALSPEGSSLTLPPLHNIKGMQLFYADRGSRLFNDEDRRLAEAMHQLFSRIQSFRQAFHDGVHEERRRVARDLHDDVGAKLLTLVYSAETEHQADLARATLQELRDVIRGLEHTDYTLGTTLGELQRETQQRCEAHKVALQWHAPKRLHDCPFDARQHSNLQRMVREAVSNALRHSDATRLQIDIGQTQTELTLQVSNDNPRHDSGKSDKPGRGMRNIKSRAEELGGTAEWRQGSASLLGGYSVEIIIPLGRIIVDE